jgi:hypothetical protein
MLSSLQQAIQQPFSLLLDGKNVGADFFERAQRLRFIYETYYLLL